jgi:hypothetical protein
MGEHIMEIEILHEDRLRTWCGWLQLPAGATEALVDMAGQIRADENLLGIFTAFYEQTSLRGEWFREWAPLPMSSFIKQSLDEHRASLFYLLGYMAALPNASRTYRRIGIRREILLDTMYDISIWMTNYFDVHSAWGFDQFAWITFHLECKLFRLGRLQFALAPFRWKIMAFRHRSSGHILLLGDPTQPLRADGYAEGAGGKEIIEDERWFAVFEATPAGWRGNRIAPQGYTMREQVFLLRSEWEPVLQHGDTVLDLHIPRGEKMTLEVCRESLQRAFSFFPEFWPDRPFKGVCCHTWFFTPQLQQILPPESNLVRFQREFYLFPHPGSKDFLWSYVFGARYTDPSTAPRDTSLRQAVLDWLSDGNELFDLPGVMLHIPEAWGTQPYYSTDEARLPQQPLPVILEEEEQEDEEEDTTLDAE